MLHSSSLSEIPFYTSEFMLVKLLNPAPAINKSLFFLNLSTSKMNGWDEIISQVSFSFNVLWLQLQNVFLLEYNI